MMGADAQPAGEYFSGVDLFGDPIAEPRDGPGRPEHRWTLENSNKVNLLFAFGYDVKDAALALGVTAPTLRKHYRAEVAKRRAARLKLKARQLALLADKAGGGDVGAIKEMFKRIDKAELAALANDVADRGRAAPRLPKLGKKEMQKLAAKQVGGKYAPPPSPPRLIN